MGNDQEMVQSDINSHSKKSEVGKHIKQSGTCNKKKTYHKNKIKYNKTETL